MDTQDVLRRDRAALLLDAHSGQVRRARWDEYHVPSQSGDGVYRVKLPRPGQRVTWNCTCKDHAYRRLDCKHILAVRLALGLPDEPEPFTPANPAPVAAKPRVGVVCKHCGGPDVTKYGRCGKRQAYWCKPCGRKFTRDRGFQRLKADPKAVTLALDLYFKGVSLRQIKDTLWQFFDVAVSHVTVYNWLKRYTATMAEHAARLQPLVGDRRWQADEMKVKYAGRWQWLWHVMDKDSQFPFQKGDALTVRIDGDRLIVEKAPTKD